MVEDLKVFVWENHFKCQWTAPMFSPIYQGYYEADYHSDCLIVWLEKHEFSGL